MTSMKARLYTIIFLIAVLCTVPVGAALAQNNASGVSMGNEFVYSLKSSWISNDPNAAMPNGLADINMTDYYKVAVTAVSGANVSTHTKWHYKNGTDVETDGSVSTETTAYQGGFWAIIASNINKNDRVHPNSEHDQSTINETVMWDYQTYKRETNHLDAGVSLTRRVISQARLIPNTSAPILTGKQEHSFNWKTSTSITTQT